MIRSNSVKEKYGLLDMPIGGEKSFPIGFYSRIRMACHFTGKKHKMSFTTRKVKTGKTHKIIVYRTK